MTVDTVATKNKALERLSSNIYDLILLDNQLSDSRGQETLASFKKLNIEAPVIVMMDPGQSNVAAEAIKCMLGGACDYIVRSDDTIEALAMLIDTSVNRHRMIKLEEQMRDETRKFSYTVENIKECVVMTDRSGVITYTNRALNETYGYAKNELIGSNISVLLDPADVRERLYGLIFSKSYQGWSGELPMFTRGGHVIQSLVTMIAIRNDSGSIISYSLLCRDITERKKAEEAMYHRIAALTHPDVEISSLDARDLFDIAELQKLQDTMARSFGVASIILDPEGIPLTDASRFNHLCQNMIRRPDERKKKCQVLYDLIRKVSSSGTPGYERCDTMGLTEAAVPIMFEDRLIACWIIGQVSAEKNGSESLNEYAGTYGLSVEDEAAGTGPAIRIPWQQFEHIMDTFYCIANQLSKMAVQNLQQARYITDRKQSEEKLLESEERFRYMSFHDSLTGLYNRAFFEEEMCRLNKDLTRAPLSIICIDLDGLKIVNDTFGHKAGDELLKDASEIISSCFRKTDIVSRIGGDEFCILLPGVDGRIANKKKEELISMISRYNSRSPLLPLSMSIGVATTQSIEGENIYDIYQRADDDMYKYKISQSDSPRSKIVDMLLTALSEKDFMAQGHSVRMAGLALAMAERIHMPDSQKRDLILLAKVHDIGKVGVPDRILLKPGILDRDEYDQMKKHTLIGYNIASRSRDLSHISDLILHHHERWDGKGYPDGLKGEDIPLACRVIAIIDAYDAMTNTRPYRKAMSKVDSIKEVLNNRGTQFDPQLVDEFIKLIEQM